MPEINHDLEARAAEALKRAQAETRLPTVDQSNGPLGVAPSRMSDAKEPDMSSMRFEPVSSTMVKAHTDVEETETVSAPPSMDEMRDAGYVTSDDVGDDSILVAPGGGDPNASGPTVADDETILVSVANDHLTNVAEDDRNQFISQLMPEIAKFRKDLIINQGYTPAEAAEASKNRVKRQSSEYAENWAKEHPEGVIVTIDKSQEDQLEFSEEEMLKMQRAKAVKLVVVEAAELESLAIKPVKKENVPMSLIRDYCGSISVYSIPLLDRADYATFTGAQSAMLATSVAGEDDDMLDLIEKKASLIYKCFAGSVTKPKKDERGKEITYEDFCNWFKYDDIDMAIYAIVTASTMEVSETTYVCQNTACRKPFNIRYNNKALLDLSGIPDAFKERLTDIDESRSSLEKIKALQEKYCVNMRVRSPFSKNVYELGSPSIAEVRERIDKCMNLIDASTITDLVLLIYVKRVWVYDEAEGNYFPPIEVQEDPKEAFEVLCRLHQIDLEMLTKYINEHHYSPAFRIKTKCPHCGREATDAIDIDSMIFLHARASLTEIQ